MINTYNNIARENNIILDIKKKNEKMMEIKTKKLSITNLTCYKRNFPNKVDVYA